MAGLGAGETAATPPPPTPAGGPARAVRDGALTVLPFVLGVVPFGIIYGMAAVGAGLPVPAALGMSGVVFAGAAQMGVVDLVARQAAWPVILLTALVINLRLVMYSASLAPRLAHLPARWKGGLAYLLTDQVFAVFTAREARAGPVAHARWYLLGAGAAMWLIWQAGTAAGVLLGPLVPASWSLDFAVPVTFIALWIPGLRGRPDLAAAVTAGAVALAGAELPYGLGLILGALAGVAAGLLVRGRAADG